MTSPRWLEELTDAEVAEQLADDARLNGSVSVSGGGWSSPEQLAREVLGWRRPWLTPDPPAIGWWLELDRLVAPTLTRALALPGELRGRLRAVWAAWRHPGDDW